MPHTRKHNFTKTHPIAASVFSALLALTAIGTHGVAHAADTAPSAPVYQEPESKGRMDAGRAAVKIKDWNKAVSEFQAAVKAEPKSADAHNMLAYSYRNLAKPNLPKSFEHYNIALKIDPNHKGAHEYIGIAYLQDGRPEKSAEHLATLNKICGKNCAEFISLNRAIASYVPNQPYSSPY